MGDAERAAAEQAEARVRDVSAVAGSGATWCVRLARDMGSRSTPPALPRTEPAHPQHAAHPPDEPDRGQPRTASTGPARLREPAGKRATEPQGAIRGQPEAHGRAGSRRRRAA